MKKSYDALVVGAGIGGIRAALDLAETGQRVALTDARPVVGGLLAQIERQFPTDNCGMCKSLPLAERDNSSQFCMRKGLFHRNIDIYLSTELAELGGEPGRFDARLRKHSQFVDPTKCVGCGLCAEACPVRVEEWFNAGLTERAAIYLPSPQAVPNHYVLDMESCQRCWKCHEACPTGAIDLKFDERKSFEVLVASPDEQLVEDMTSWFERLQFPISGVQVGEKVLDRVADEDKRPGMVLYDLSFTDVSPERVVGRLAELGVPVALMGTKRHEAKSESLMDMGARCFVRMPMGKDKLVPWLDKFYMGLKSEQDMEIEAAAVILATGFECYNPDEVGQVYRHGANPDVLTSLEFERLLSPIGPTKGRLVRPSDGGGVRKIGWVQCVGSRDVQKKANYCSSICCMITLKEARMAMEKARKQGGDLDAAVFYMDLRTFGKDYQDYAEATKADKGLRLIRSRVHSVADPEDPGNGTVRVAYLDQGGALVEEDFDLLVLAVGGRAPKDMAKLAKAADIELNEHGFPATVPFEPARTSRFGVFAAGSCSGPRDISESMLMSSAAALGASRLINLYAPIMDKRPEPEPEYRDVSREPPKVLAALCRSCPILENNVDLERIESALAAQIGVAEVVEVERACTKAGWEELAAHAERAMPNRVLIGACMPYAYVPKLHELGKRINLRPTLMDVVDIYTALPKGDEPRDKERAEKDVRSALTMAAVKLMGADPTPLPGERPVAQSALVIGGGLAGMTAALGIADHGYKVHLVEEAEELGGMAMRVRRTLAGEDSLKFMQDLVGQVEKHPNIDVYKDSRVALAIGRAGRFMSVISGEEGSKPVEYGAAILATGGQEARVYEWGFKVHKSVVTHQDLENRLAEGALDAGALSSVVMIQCWRGTEADRRYCSRVCCQGAVKNILELKRKNPKLPVYVFYQDFMTYGFSESYYTEARKAGAVFIPFTPERKPVVKFEEGKPVVKGFDPVLGMDVEIRPDLVALASGIEAADNVELSEMFGVPLDEHGFFKEAEYKWRPADFMRHGLFTCGLARAPGNMEETIASAKASAQRALRVLSEKRLSASNVVAIVRHTLCSRCGRCIDVCPYGARGLDTRDYKIVVDELLCQGCGSCAAVCPNSATSLRGLDDVQVMRTIDAALEEL